MIIIKIELWPHGDALSKKLLGLATIVNDATGTLSKGNYAARFCRTHNNWGMPWKKSRVVGFPRLRLSPWHLLHAALDAALGAGPVPRKQGRKARSRKAERKER